VPRARENKALIKHIGRGGPEQSEQQTPKGLDRLILQVACRASHYLMFVLMLQVRHDLQVHLNINLYVVIMVALNSLN
jgi:hypothetical protein